MRLLVTRPQPGADASGARLRALGHDVTVAPLLGIAATPWAPPPLPPAAIMLTSAAAVRSAGPAAAAFHALPAFVVGTATADAARAAGFRDVRPPAGTVQALLDGLAAAGIADVLHLAGADRTPVTIPTGLRVTTAIVYRARLLPLPGCPDADAVLLYSARTAAHFAAECDRLGCDRASIALAAISPTVLAAAGPGWRRAVSAASPDETALLAAIAATWQRRDQSPAPR